MSRTARRLTLAALSAAALVSASTAAAAPAGAASSGTVAGVVRDGSTPVGAGVVVTARTPADTVLATATTDAAGAYTLTAVPTGDRVICFDGSAVTNARTTAGYLFSCHGGATAADAAPVHVTSTRTVTVDAVVRRAVAITGLVTDSSGAAAVGVRVDPTPYAALPPAVTGADGRYRDQFDPDGVYALAPCFDGGGGTGPHTQAGYLDVCEQNDREQPVAGRTYVYDRVVAPATALAGRVTDYAGRPLSGVKVDVRTSDWGVEKTATTAADGSYQVEQVPGHVAVTLEFVPTAATVGRSALGYTAACWRNAPSGYGFCRSDATEITTRTGAVQTGYDAVLHAAGGISGRVVDVQGRGISTLTLTVTGTVDPTSQDGYTRTATDGSYTFPNLDPAQPHIVCAEVDYPNSDWPDPDGYASDYTRNCWHLPGNDGYGDPVPVTAGKVTTGTDIVLIGNGGIAGRTVDASGASLTGVPVDVSGPHGRVGTVVTRSDGSFRVGYLEVGRYHACYGRDPYPGSDHPAPTYGWVEQCITVDVTDNATATIPTTTMVEGGSLAGTVTDSYGFTVDGTRVHLVNVKSGATYDATTYDGTFSVDQLAAGHYTVCFDPAVAHRHRDGTAPKTGYAKQCWKNAPAGQPPLAVLVTSGAERTGVGAALKAKPAA